VIRFQPAFSSNSRNTFLLLAVSNSHTHLQQRQVYYYTDDLMIVKQVYAGISGAASASTSTHQRTSTVTYRQRRKSLVKVRL